MATKKMPKLDNEAKIKAITLSGKGPKDSVNISIRKIDNGFILSHSSMGKDGYQSSETYHPKEPNIADFTKAKKMPKVRST